MNAGSFTLPGPAGAIECLLKLPAGPPRLAALVCHPHPLFGGSMHGKVVYRAAAALVAAGAAALRFNFRSVGLSRGAHDGGRGEAGDVRLLVDHLAAGFPGLPLLVAGYSFGAWVGLRAAAPDARVAALVGIGLATRLHGFDELRAAPQAKLVVQGDRDPLGSIESVRALVASWPEPRRLVVVPGADHSFAGALDALGEAITRFAAEPPG